jgi:hypothetical protein
VKYFALLFNLYLLVLPCLPCKDSVDCANENKTSYGINKESSPKENHKEDNCTPFCHCNCCSTPCFYFVSGKEKTNTKIYTVKKFILLDEVFTSNNINAIWQPPRA